MGRTPRFDLPGIPQHIVQRGNNRLPCFLGDRDRLDDLHLLREALTATGVQLHAYVLMDNHVHLLATPHGPGDLSRMMQRFGRQYVGLFNARQPYRHVMGRSIQGMPGRRRTLSADLPALHRAQSCARPDHRRSRCVPLVQLRCTSRAACRFVTDAPPRVACAGF